MYNEEQKKILNADFFKDILEYISSTRTVSDAVGESVCTQMMFFVTEVLIKTKDNAVACGQYEATEDFVRCALRDAGFPLIAPEKITPPMLKFPLKLKKDVEVPTELTMFPENWQSDTAIKVHWLAIDGVQPAIPENPDEVTVSNKPDFQRKEEDLKEAGIINCMNQQVYFKQIMETVMGGTDINRNKALLCLRSDPHLTSLLPHFGNAVVEGVRINLIQENVTHLIYYMRIADALLQNNLVKVEKIVLSLLPNIISVLVMRGTSELTWKLREYCAKLLLLIINRFKQPQLYERIVCLLSKSLYREDAHAPMIYGIVFSLQTFGPESVEHALLPHLEVISKKIGPFMTENKQNKKYPERTAAAKRVHDLVCRVIRLFQDEYPERSQTPKFLDLFKYFGCA